jgi:3,4-dihydroxy-2-butanone 4-phosphate synthase
MAPIHLNPTKIERDRRSAAGAVCFNMTGVRINRLNQRSLTHTESSEYNDFAPFLFGHQDKIWRESVFTISVKYEKVKKKKIFFTKNLDKHTCKSGIFFLSIG